MPRLTLAAQLLQKWRTKRDLVQGRAAELLGVTQPTLSDYEKGKKTPRTERALKIEKVTGGEVPVATWVEDAVPESGHAGTSGPAKGAA